MNVEIDEIDFEKVFFPYKKMGLQNVENENKCWANVSAQALKACPCFRNFVFQKLRGMLSSVDNEAYWNDQTIFAFWESFLHNSLRDGFREFQNDTGLIRRQKTPFNPGFFGTVNYGRSEFGYLEMPWKHPLFGFEEKFKVSERNDIREFTDGLQVFSASMKLMDEKVMVHVRHDEAKWRDQDKRPQEDGPFIVLNALHKCSVDSNEKYSQKNDGTKSLFVDRIEFEDTYYKTSINEELKSMSDNEEFLISDEGKILVVCVDVKLDHKMISFAESGPNFISEEDRNHIINELDGFRVFSRMKAESVLSLQGKLFALTAIIKSTINRHFIVNTDGNLQQQWWKIDDEDVFAVLRSSDFQDVKKKDSPNSVGFVYERIDLGIEAAVVEPAIKDIIDRNVAGNKFKWNSFKEIDTEIFQPFFGIALHNVGKKGNSKVIEDILVYNTKDVRCVKRFEDGVVRVPEGNGALAISGSKTSASNKKTIDEKEHTRADSDEEDDLPDNEDDEFQEIEDDPNGYIGKGFYMMDGLESFRGKVDSVHLKRSDKQLFYKVSYAKDNSYQFLQLMQLQQYFLNGRNGTMFTFNQKEDVLTDVVDMRSKKNAANSITKKKIPPDDLEVLVKWNNDDLYVWENYNYTMFHVDCMQKFLNSQTKNICFRTFQKQEREMNDSEMKEYRYVPKKKKKEAFVKVKFGDNTTKDLTLEEALDCFGKKGLAKIIEQYNLLPSTQTDVWFFVNTGMRTMFGTGLEPMSNHYAIEMRNPDFHVPVVDNNLNYLWVSNTSGSWMKNECIKTKGVFCISAAVTNCLDGTISECSALFSSILPLHLANGEINVGSALNKAQQFVHNTYRFQFFKMKRLISFCQFHENKELYFGKEDVVVVCYKTTTNCTHAISWNVGNKRILDPDMTNPNVLTYTNFGCDSSSFLQLLQDINTTMNDPCILYIGCWDRKVMKKRIQKRHCTLEGMLQKQPKC